MPGFMSNAETRDNIFSTDISYYQNCHKVLKHNVRVNANYACIVHCNDYPLA